MLDKSRLFLRPGRALQGPMRRWEADPLLNGINFSPKVFDARSGKAMEISISYMFNFHCFVRSEWRAIGELSTTLPEVQ